MNEYVISKQEINKWCSIPMEELARHPARKMDLRIRQEKSSIDREVADLLVDEVIQNNSIGKPTRWVLPGGPAGQYDAFVERVNTENVDLKNVYIFHMDTWLDWQFRLFPESNLRFSCLGKMNKLLYNRIRPELNVPKEQRFFPDPLQPDLFDERIKALGGIDTVVGGVGCKGLVAFNENPNTYYHRFSLEEYAQSKSRIVRLREDTIIAYAERDFGSCFEALPPNAFTIGMKSMLTAKRAVFVVTTGTWKQTIVRVALFSDPTTEYPVTLFPAYVPNCLLYCDPDTANHVISYRYKELPTLK